jgi:hypothetical protein
MTTTLTLAGREQVINEPCFKHLRLIIDAYAKLSADSGEPEKLAAVEFILNTLAGNAIKLSKLSTTELIAFLQAVPDICGLKTVTGTNEKTKTDWGFLYAHLSACLGWTYDYIDNNMTLSRLNEYRGYWKTHPPTHQLVAAYMGYEAKDQNNGSQFLAALAAQVKKQ